jgi:hypothetical protein
MTSNSIAYSVAEEVAKRIVDESRHMDMLSFAIYTHGTLDCLITRHQSSPPNVVYFQTASWDNGKVSALLPRPPLMVREKDAIKALVSGRLALEDMRYTNLDYWCIRYIFYTGSATPPDKLGLYEDFPNTIQSGLYDNDGENEDMDDDEPPPQNNMRELMKQTASIAWDILKA